MFVLLVVNETSNWFHKDLLPSRRGSRQGTCQADTSKFLNDIGLDFRPWSTKSRHIVMVNIPVTEKNGYPSHYYRILSYIRSHSQVDIKPLLTSYNSCNFMSVEHRRVS